MKTVRITCAGCGVNFNKPNNEYQRCLRRKYSQFFCSRDCRKKYQKRNSTKKIGECPNCGKTTVGKKFCNHSCSSSYNNSLREKVVNLCEVCGIEINKRNKFCKKHKEDRWTHKTIGELRLRYGRAGDQFPIVRWHARKVAKGFGILDKCVVCGYTNHVETAHRFPLSKYTDDTLIGDINTKDNLIGLCPNHHWEFDHGIIFL